LNWLGAVATSNFADWAKPNSQKKIKKMKEKTNNQAVIS
jgi:hypothetical protein